MCALELGYISKRDDVEIAGGKFVVPNGFLAELPTPAGPVLAQTVVRKRFGILGEKMVTLIAKIPGVVPKQKEGPVNIEQAEAECHLTASCQTEEGDTIINLRYVKEAVLAEARRQAVAPFN
jgi:hypothetical protein